MFPHIKITILLLITFFFLIKTGFTEEITIYAKAQQVVKKAYSAGKLEDEISDIYLLWAGKARDQSEHISVRKLFEAALQANPGNIRGHRLYGDYLMGYRGANNGLYEQAAHHYFQTELFI